MSIAVAPKLAQLLSPRELALISSLATRRKHRDGEIIHERGDKLPAIGVVISGKIKLVYPRSDGLDIFSGLIHTGQNYGDAALIKGQMRTHRAVAVGDTVIDHIDGNAFEQLLEHPAIVRALYVVSAFRLSVALDLLDDMRVLTPDVRLANLVIRMHDSAGGPERLEFVQEDLASILGVSTVTLAKSLRKLKQQGLVETGYRHIRIKNPAKLLAWIEENAPH